MVASDAPKGNEMSSLQVREMIAEALQDDKFDKKPERMKNCVRVFYKAGHHVDVPAFRVSDTEVGGQKCEIASSEWRESDPKQINSWLNTKVSDYNAEREDKGKQFRVIIRLLKRFCRSRTSWNMPSGLVLTMLAEENMPEYDRIDECFYYMLKAINERLENGDMRVFNLSDEFSLMKEELTKSDDDPDIRNLRDRSGEALAKLLILHDQDCTKNDARQAWDWVFKSDGFFEDEDDSEEDDAPSNTFGIATNTPDKAVDLQGGGRFG